MARAVHDQSLRARHAVRGDQLRRAAREPDRKRTVRPSQRQLHRRRRAPRRACSKWPTAARCFSTRSASCPRPMQAKLLRFLESGEIRRVGENESFIVDVRVICATHRDLQSMVDDGDFREDLMFRINTFEIHLPPLRDRTRGHSRAGRALDEPLSPARRGRATSRSRPRRSRRLRGIPGRATCASWPT